MLNESHTYDFKLENTKKDIETHLSRVENLSKNDKIANLAKFAKKIHGTPGISNFNVLLSDYNAENTRNYDSSNKINAIDLLYLCAELSDNPVCSKDVIELTAIQLDEISGGSCPIGRVARLLQVVISFYEFL